MGRVWLGWLRARARLASSSRNRPHSPLRSRRSDLLLRYRKAHAQMLVASRSTIWISVRGLQQCWVYQTVPRLEQEQSADLKDAMCFVVVACSLAQTHRAEATARRRPLQGSLGTQSAASWLKSTCRYCTEKGSVKFKRRSSQGEAKSCSAWLPHAPERLCHQAIGCV